VDTTPRQHQARSVQFRWPGDEESAAGLAESEPGMRERELEPSADPTTVDSGLQPILLAPASESTPLLQNAVSFPDDVNPDRNPLRPTSYHTKLLRTSTISTTRSRRSDRSVKHESRGRSTYGQTVCAVGSPHKLVSDLNVALQQHRDAPWCRHAVGSTRLRILWLGWRNPTRAIVRFHHLLHRQNPG
jgi:hypothetical protein